jgi:hypothetical protein
MNQLQIVHKKQTSKNQKTEQVEEVEIRRKERIEAFVSSRRMYRLEGSNIFYIESSKPSITYYCRYIFGSKGNNNFCSCKDFEYRGHKRDCCHLEMIPVGIMKGKIIDVSALPKEPKRFTNQGQLVLEQVPQRPEIQSTRHHTSEENRIPKSWRNDQYVY